MKKTYFIAVRGLAVLMTIVLLAACAQDKTNDETTEAPISTDAKPTVTMTLEDGEEVVMELYPEVAPNTVNNFIALAEDGFYDGLIFHRVIKGFMVQGGDPEGTGTGGPGYAIKGEFSSNGAENNLTHEPGVISMARSEHPDSAGSQFFIVTGEADHLDGDYASFGKVIEGMENVEAMEKVETDETDRPQEDVVIETMTVELNGYEAKAPEKE